MILSFQNVDWFVLLEVMESNAPLVAEALVINRLSNLKRPAREPQMKWMPTRTRRDGNVTRTENCFGGV